MRLQGKITEWNDDRGFGFVTTNGTNDRYFFHISELPGSAARPTVGRIVTYEIDTPSGKKPNAVKVRYPGTTPVRATRAGRPWGWSPDVIIAGAHIAIPLWLVIAGRLPALLIAAIAGMSFVAFVMYNIDKRRAEREAWRIPESNLQFVGLAGGWLGALSAQCLFRHKSSKTAYVHLFRFYGVLALALMIGAAHFNVPRLLNGI